jgi:hypothetical protein
MHSAYGSRLLSIGEIFDRAVHVTFANLLPLAAIVGTVAVPIRAISDWISRNALTYSFISDGRIVADPRLLPNYFTLMKDPQVHGFDWPAFLWSIGTLLPLSLAAATASIAMRGILLGETPKLDEAYRTAVRRLAPIFGATVLSWSMYVAAIAAIVIIAIAVLLLLSLIIARGGPVGPTADPVVVIFFVAICAAVAWLAPWANCTTTGAALYPIRPVQALREARMMTMSRGHRTRSLAFGAALLAFVIAQEFIRLTVCGFLSDVSHSSMLSFVASDAITLLALLIDVALAVVFYLDARNRVGLIQDPLANQENSRSQ